MVCHLCDSFRFALGEVQVNGVSTWLDRTVIRWIALHTPLPWPKGVRTRPELDQKIGGTPPKSFEKDRTELLALMWRFVEESGRRPAHPIFGKLTEDEWQHWGWRHVDHHLRQFGV